MITTTLNRIRENGPCQDGWEKLLRHLGKSGADDEPLPYSVIVESNGLPDAVWCCRVEPQHAREWRLYAVWCARQLLDSMTDERSRAALDVAERYANGEATDEELAAAWHAAWHAACDARDVHAAAWAARATATNAAGTAAWHAARAVARAVARNAQTAKFLEIVG